VGSVAWRGIVFEAEVVLDGAPGGGGDLDGDGGPHPSPAPRVAVSLGSTGWTCGSAHDVERHPLLPVAQRSSVVWSVVVSHTR
jgi:hypothetical protein